MTALLKRNAERMRNLIMQLLDFEKMMSGNRAAVKSVNNIIETLAQTVEEMRLIAEKKKTVLIFDNNTVTEIYLLYDAELIKRALINLIDNAVKYCPEGSRIAVSVADKEKMISITVRDNGYGISPESQEFLFERFYQVEEDKGMTDKPFGLGLGLSMVKKIAETHGGTIRVESEPGAGASFIFTLPKEEKTAGKV